MILGSENKENGFTLVELLVAMAIGLVVLGGVYSLFNSQQKSYVLQEQVAAMQQNIRASMYFMTREIRMAGCDPTGKADTGIIGATRDSIHFTRDIKGSSTNNKADGDTNDENEDITYSFVDSNGDGVKDSIFRNVGVINQAIAQDISMLDFVYLDQNDNVLNPGLTGVAENNLSKITTVQLTVIARTDRGDQGFANKESFLNRQGVEILNPQNDNFHRKILTSFIRCRNL
jgi:type IV pilus assembly protein PilW